MIKNDPNLITVINILNESKIFYWLGQGTLLGIHRDNKLIEWDHDIDICVWHDSNNKENTIKLLESVGFEYREDLEFGDDKEQMSFDKSGGRRVDINFYQKGEKENGEKIAFMKWTVPKNIFMKIIDAISNVDTYDSKFKIIIKSLRFLKPLAVYLKNISIEKKFFYRFVGYQQPLRLLQNFKTINFHNLKVIIPLYAEEYLEYIYGENWKIPLNKKYIWWKTKNIKNNFE